MKIIEGRSPARAVQAQVGKDRHGVGRQTRLAIAFESTRGVDESQAAREREAVHQAHTPRLGLAPVVHQGEPEPLLLSGVVGPGRQVVAERR
ncbi:hypothetical protein [Singulisphaera sp. GP187]|uniref:hypothetical protein n=1 Tax=Singulisphaera sp. GP187 TaxID=1882752 RepID=UPI000940F348|nr:hypothetical protein [Singulisphaera sp. GP187]